MGRRVHCGYYVWLPIAYCVLLNPYQFENGAVGINDPMKKAEATVLLNLNTFKLPCRRRSCSRHKIGKYWTRLDDLASGEEKREKSRQTRQPNCLDPADGTSQFSCQ